MNMKNYKNYISNSRNHLDSFGEVIVKHYLNNTSSIHTIYININSLSIINLILFFHHKTDIIQMPRAKT